jgi:pimeloyl-ACP methyl ester carboxylesterase
MELETIEHLVLVANGEDDRMVTTRSSFELAHRLRNASLRIYPDAGHGGVFQYHERYVPEVLAFLS